MIEDRLTTHDERIRLNCVARAIASNTGSLAVGMAMQTMQAFVRDARTLEYYVTGRSGS